MTKKVNFFIVGAPKCGTTTLYHFLNGHKQIDFGNIKEPHLFASDLRLKGATNPFDYMNSYDTLNPETCVYGDASVMHLFSINAARSIFEYNPSAKIFVMLRRPLDFVISYHHEQLYNQIEDCASLQRAWDLTELRIAGCNVPPNCPDPRLLDYKSIAAFDEQIQRFVDFFATDQVKVGFVEDMKLRETEFIAALYRFLGVNSDNRFQLGHHASAKAYKHAWQRQAVKLASHPTAQLVWKKSKRALGINRRFQLVHKFRVAATVTGNKLPIDQSLAKAIEAHYSLSWAAVQKLSRSHGLLSSRDADLS